MNSSKFLKPSALALALVGALGAQSVLAKSYVMTSSGATWGAAQDAAVAAGGGTIKFKSAGAGIAVVESSNKSFLKNAQKSGAVKGTEDMMVQWQDPMQDGGIVEMAVNPDDESRSALQWSLDAVHAQDAWAVSGLTGAGVRVAVLDGGIWDQHVDLINRIDFAASTSFVPGFGFNQDTGTFWHGTHVAGIVAAEDNTIGTVGMAPGATIVGVKVLHNGSGSFGAVIAGILYAGTPTAEGGGGADIINMSLGSLFPRGGGNTGAGQLVAATARAINYATDRNVLVVASAGNSGVDLDHSGSYITVPAQAGSAIAISATGPFGWAYGDTSYNRPASYTNYGTSAVWVAGPGGDFAWPTDEDCTVNTLAGDITRPCWVFDMVFSTVRGTNTSTYGWAAGTSMSAPAVAGIAALVKERFPGISVGDLKTKLAQTADGKSPYLGKGMVNALRAVTE